MTDKYTIDDIRSLTTDNNKWTSESVDINDCAYLMNQAYEEGIKFCHSALIESGIKISEPNMDSVFYNLFSMPEAIFMEALANLGIGPREIKEENEKLKSVLIENTRALADTVKENEQLKSILNGYIGYENEELRKEIEQLEHTNNLRERSQDKLTEENEKLKQLLFESRDYLHRCSTELKFLIAKLQRLSTQGPPNE